MPFPDARKALPFEAFLARLHESREMCVYEAIERLVSAGEQAGMGADDLLRMLDKGVDFRRIARTDFGGDGERAASSIEPVESEVPGEDGL